MAGATTVQKIILGTLTLVTAVELLLIAGLYAMAGYNRRDAFLLAVAVLLALAVGAVLVWFLRRLCR